MEIRDLSALFWETVAAINTLPHAVLVETRGFLAFQSCVEDGCLCALSADALFPPESPAASSPPPAPAARAGAWYAPSRRMYIFDDMDALFCATAELCARHAPTAPRSEALRACVNRMNYKIDLDGVEEGLFALYVRDA